MVRGAVLGITLNREAHDLPEEAGINLGDGTQRLQITRSGRLKMHELTGEARGVANFR